MKTNYEAIKEMSIEEMSAVFYIFVKPFMDSFETTDEQRKSMRESIKSMLNSECKFYGKDHK